MKAWTLRLCVAMFLAVGIEFLLVGVGIIEPWSEAGSGPPPPRWVFGVIGILFFLPCLMILTGSFLRPGQPSATSGAASSLGSILGALVGLILLGCLASLSNYAAYERIRDIPRLGIWGKVAMIIGLVFIGGGALILDAVFVGLIVAALSAAFRRLR